MIKHGPIIENAGQRLGLLQPLVCIGTLQVVIDGSFRLSDGHPFGAFRKAGNSSGKGKRQPLPFGLHAGWGFFDRIMHRHQMIRVQGKKSTMACLPHFIKTAAWQKPYRYLGFIYEKAFSGKQAHPGYPAPPWLAGEGE